MELRTPFKIGDYHVVPMSGQIVGPGGETRVQPKVVDVLLCLAENQGEVVEREDILARVWGRAIVTDDSLTRCIGELRRAFGEKRGNYLYLQTVSKRGYKLLQSVSPTDGNLASDAGPASVFPGSGDFPRNQNLQARSIPQIDSPTVSVAVLPFENLSQDPEHSFIGDALVMELQNSLSQLHRVRLISQRSSAVFQKDDADPESTAKRLGIQYLISGSVQCTGKRMRVIAQLESPRDGTLLWSDTYDADIGDILAVERNVAGAIAGAFGGERLKLEIRRAKSRSKTDLDAWSLVQRARHYLISYDLEALSDAVPLLEHAIEIDANYAAAHAMLGSVIAEKIINCVSTDPDSDRVSAQKLVEHAWSLEPRDSFIIRMAGSVFAYCGDYDRSIRILRRAVESFEYDLGAWGYLGWPLIASGRPEDLAELGKILARLIESAANHPGAVYWRFHRSVARTAEGDYRGAMDDAQSVIDEQPKFALGWMQLANVMGHLGKTDPARKAVTRCESTNPAMTPEAYASLMGSLTDQETVIQTRTDGLRAAGLI